MEAKPKYVWGPTLEHDKRGCRRWRVVVAGEGERGRTAKTFRSEVRALDAAEKLRREIDKGTTVSEAIALFELHQVRERGNRPSSASLVSGRLRRILGDGRRSIEGVTNKELCRWYEQRSGSGRFLKAKPQCSVATHHGELAAVRDFFGWCVKQGWLRASPADGIEKVGRANKGKLQLRGAEARALLAHAVRRAAEGDDGGLAVAVILSTGACAGELLQRRVRDVDDVGGRGLLLWIDEQLGATVKRPSRRRTLWVGEPVATVLRAHVKGRAPLAWLFPGGSSGGARGKTWLRKVTRRLCDEAEVQVVCPHGLRGTWASLGAAEGAARRDLQADLGHGDLRSQEAYVDATAAHEGTARRMLRLVVGGE